MIVGWKTVISSERGITSSTMTNVYADSTNEFSFVLKPSAIEGIGVHALHAIAKGTRLHLFAENEEVRVVPRSEGGSDPKKKHFYEWYCVEDQDADVFYCPSDFNRMSIGWYLNHAAQPNATNINDEFFALTDIQEGEEVTIHYNDIEPWKQQHYA